eukprot:gene2310-7017_t
MADALQVITLKVTQLSSEIQDANTRSITANSKVSEQAAVIAQLERTVADQAQAMIGKDKRIAEEMNKRREVERELEAVKSELSELGLG